MDFVLGGQGHGSVASILVNNNFDVGALRPYTGQDGRQYNCLTANEGKPSLVQNADALLRVREWIELDEAVSIAAKPRMKAWDDLKAAGLIRRLKGGMANTVLQYQTMSDISPATISMDGLRQSERDRPAMDLRSLPLPIIHKDFSFSSREILQSRVNGIGLDTSMAALASRRCAEEAEKLLIGVSPTYSYGGGTIYGYKNFPDRATYTLQPPNGVGWTPDKTIADVLGMIDIAQTHFAYGPFALYCSSAWSRYMGMDYSPTKGGNTLMQRILAIDEISSIRKLDYLTGWDLILVQMDPETVQGIEALRMTTIQWPGQGGMEINFKVMCMRVPRLKSDKYNNCGIVHAA